MADAMGFDHLWTFDHMTWGGLPDSRSFARCPRSPPPRP